MRPHSDTEALLGILLSVANRERLSFERERGIREIRAISGIAHVSVRNAATIDERLKALSELKNDGISIFLLKFHNGGLSFALNASRIDRTVDLLRKAGFECVTNPGCVLVSLFAQNVREMPDAFARMSEALFECGAPVVQTGDAHDRINCLIPGQHAQDAVENLRARFGVDRVSWE